MKGRAGETRRRPTWAWGEQEQEQEEKDKAGVRVVAMPSHRLIDGASHARTNETVCGVVRVGAKLKERS